MAGTTAVDATLPAERSDPREFLALLDQLSANEFGIGFVYSALELLARQYHLDDALVVLGDESLGTQAFRLDRKPVSGDTQSGVVATPGVICVPDAVPEVVKDVVTSVCQLALSLHVARHGGAHDRLTNIANRRYFDTALRTAAMQSARYGWKFTLVLADVNGYANTARQGRASVSDELVRNFALTLRQSVRSGDTATRIGADGFGVILWNAERAEVSAFTERLASLPLPDGQHVSLTIGTASAPRDSTDPDELFRLATNRLADAKASAAS